MKKKKFDCVAMKRSGAAAVYQITKDMTVEQKVEFWRKASEALLKRQEAARLRARGQLTKSRK
jgi:hypothetical protein